MSYSHYDRLSALDESFLLLEDAHAHMHVGSVGIFEGGELVLAEGGLDMERIDALSEWALERNPRFRQRLEYVPLLGDPVWVDDRHFNLRYHVRHTALPAPGDERQLKRLAGRIMSQQLDRSRPLWEIWYVEGLDEGRFAVIAKIHHCMIDGVAAGGLLGSFMGKDPDHRPGKLESSWIPRPHPGPLKLIGDELRRRAKAPLRALSLPAEILRSPGRSLRDLGSALEGLAEVVSNGFSSASGTPLNEPIGPHRRFDWLRFELSDVKEVKQKHGGTVNDVVLATVTLAMREFLKHRNLDVGELDFRVLVPVNIRPDDEIAGLGNRVAFLTVPLPVGETDPRRVLERVTETTSALKASHLVEGTELVERFSDAIATGLIGTLSRLAGRILAYNLVVTNVPGPQEPSYLLGSRLIASYPLVPLFSNQVLGIALYSYDGGIFWGLNSDWEAMPDLHEIVDGLQTAFEVLRKA